MTRFKEQLKANLGKWAAKHKRHNCAQLTIQHLTITQGVVIATKHSEKAVENLAKSISLARLRDSETHTLSAKQQYEEDCIFATVTFQADLDGTIHVQMADSPDVLATSEKQAIYEENVKNVLVRAASPAALRRALRCPPRVPLPRRTVPCPPLPATCSSPRHVTAQVPTLPQGASQRLRISLPQVST